MPLYRAKMTKDEQRWLRSEVKRGNFSMQRRYSITGEVTVLLVPSVSCDASSDNRTVCGKLFRSYEFYYTCGKRKGHERGCDD